MHDFTPHESGVPRQITPVSPNDYVEVADAGALQRRLAWRVVQSHWEALSDAFADFDPYVAAGHDDRERALCRRVRYIGQFGAYWSLCTLKFDGPDHREWAEARGRDLPTYPREPG
jgi:hypothetical protein